MENILSPLQSSTFTSVAFDVPIDGLVTQEMEELVTTCFRFNSIQLNHIYRLILASQHRVRREPPTIIHISKGDISLYNVVFELESTPQTLGDDVVAPTPAPTPAPDTTTVTEPVMSTTLFDCIEDLKKL